MADRDEKPLPDSANSGKPANASGRDRFGRFEKGAPSANPNGAPRKDRRIVSPTQGFDPVADMIMRHARMPAARRADGTVIDRAERALETLYLKATDKEKPDTRALIEYTRLFRESWKSETEHKLRHLSYVLEHKAKWGPRFELNQRMGKPPPRIWPHPDDFVIHADGTIDILGPVDREGQKKMEETLGIRNQVLELLTTNGGWNLDDPEIRRQIKKTLRQLEEVNLLLPSRLRQGIDIESLRRKPGENLDEDEDLLDDDGETEVS